ncbi:phosphatidylserine decarboxylase family protein [Candidatus Dependentiae bacterium]|nr:phosphatidylserine decarboxylase family protein [Candidatus Dependentiae bacterium]
MLKFRKEGLVYIVISGLIITFFFLVGIRYTNFLFFIIAGIMIIPAVFIIYFFRDPERYPDTSGEYDYICPADGEILLIDEINDEVFLKEKVRKISVFMNIFSVHVNRSPIDGKLVKLVFNPGIFLPAFRDAASVKNERVDFFIKGRTCNTRVSLISGIIARRIVPFVQMNHNLKKKERIGMIKFGSRVDCYLPLDFKVHVQKGDKVFAGKTLLASK